MEHGPDKENKDGEPDKPVGKNKIYVSRYIHTLLCRCCEDFPDDAGDKSVALVGHYDFRLVIESVHEKIPLRRCFFKNLWAVFSGFQLDALFYDFVIFYKLYGGPSKVVRNGPFRKAFNEMFQFGNGIFDVLTVFYFTLYGYHIIGLRQFNGLFQERIDAFVFVAHRKNHRNIKKFREFFCVDFNSPGLGNILHVQGEQDFAINLSQLCCQVKTPFQVGCVDDVDNNVRTFFQHKIPCNDLFYGKRG